MEEREQNNRLVNLTSVPEKLVEALIKNRLVYHMDEQDFLGKSQWVFYKQRTCFNNLLWLFVGVNRYMDWGDSVNILCLDF